MIFKVIQVSLLFPFTSHLGPRSFWKFIYQSPIAVFCPFTTGSHADIFPPTWHLWNPISTPHHPPPSPGRILQSPSPCSPCIVPLGTAPLDPGNLSACVSGILNAIWRDAWISLEGTVFGVCKHRMCCHSSVPQSSFSIILLTNNHVKDATSDSPWFIRILLSRKEAGYLQDSVGSLAYQTLPVLGGQQFWRHLRLVTLVLQASCPDAPHTRVFPKWAESLPQIFTAHCTPLDCNQFPYWRVSLPASSTLHKHPPYSLWLRN